MGQTHSISKKKKDALYNLIHEDIMKARVDLQLSLTDEPSKKIVDNVLCKICYKTAQKAIELFLKTQDNGTEK